jgi:hypothetical protein
VTSRRVKAPTDRAERLRQVSVLFVVLVAISIGCADSASERSREEFVRRFTVSAREGSEFYRTYVSENETMIIEEARAKITDEFSIIHRDRHSPDTFEYVLRFTNGATAIVTVDEVGGHIKHASLVINLQPAR